jgi:hypothetical protein
MKVLHLEVNKSLEKEPNQFRVKSAAILIQRTVRHWLKRFEDMDSHSEYGIELPLIQISEL